MGSFKNSGISNVLSRMRQHGQGMTEYIIIVALIVVAAIGVYSFFGQTVREQPAGTAKELSGQKPTGEPAGAKSTAGKASTDAQQLKGKGDSPTSAISK